MSCAPLSSFNTRESFLCCSFYFNLKQMVAHRCEQLWPLEHKEQALALNVPFPPHTGPFVPLVPSSLSPPAWPVHRQLLSYVLARTWPLGRSTWWGRIWEQRPSERFPWGKTASSVYPLSSSLRRLGLQEGAGTQKVSGTGVRGLGS